MPSPSNTPRTQIHRKPQRAHHQPATIRAIIDEALVCQIAFNQGGSVHCLPMACWREGDFLYIHGASNSRLVQTLLEQECAVGITHLDGLVLARSAFHHSMNYRSVAIYGRFEAEDDPAAKAAAFRAFVEHVSPGRAARVRPPSPAELAGTRLLRIAFDEAVAKIRNWGAEDADEDMAIPVWAGVLPLALGAGPLQPEAGCAERLPPVAPAFIGRPAGVAGERRR